jgi:hypothetical protein
VVAAHECRVVTLVLPAAAGAAAWAVAEPNPAATSAITPVAAKRSRRGT